MTSKVHSPEQRCKDDRSLVPPLEPPRTQIPRRSGEQRILQAPELAFHTSLLERPGSRIESRATTLRAFSYFTGETSVADTRPNTFRDLEHGFIRVHSSLSPGGDSRDVSDVRDLGPARGGTGPRLREVGRVNEFPYQIAASPCHRPLLLSPASINTTCGRIAGGLANKRENVSAQDAFRGIRVSRSTPVSIASGAERSFALGHSARIIEPRRASMIPRCRGLLCGSGIENIVSPRHAGSPRSNERLGECK